MAERLERGVLKLRRQTKPLEPVDQVVGEKQEMEVGLIGEEVTGGDLSQGVISFELPDEEFDPGAVIIKTPEIQGLQGEIGDQDLVMVLPLFEEGQLFGGFFGLRSSDDDEAIGMRPSKRLVMELGRFHASGGRGITKMREFPFDRSGQLGDEDEEGVMRLDPFHELMVVEPFIGTDQDGSDSFRDLGETSGQKVLRTGGGMGVPGSEFPMPEVFGDSFEAEERVIRGATSLERIIPDTGTLLLSIEDQDGGIDVEDEAGWDARACRHSKEESVMQFAEFWQKSGSQAKQEPSQGGGIGIGGQSGEVPEDAILLQEMGRLKTLNAQDHGVKKGQDRLADAEVIVSLLKSKVGGERLFESESRQKSVKKIHSSEMSQVRIAEGYDEMSGPFGHCNEPYLKSSFRCNRLTGPQNKNSAALVGLD